MITRLVLYATLGCLLDALGQSAGDWGFWCVVGLFIATDILARKEGQDHGIWITLSLPADKLTELKQQLDKDIKDAEQ
jgi:hypothetical protein